MIYSMEANVKEGDIVFVTTKDVVADHCQVLWSFPELPYHVLVKSLITGDEYDVYPAWHCYKTEEKAIAAAQKYKEGHIDIIY